MSTTRRHTLLGGAYGEQPVINTFSIVSEDSYLGKFFYCVCKYNGEQVIGTWSLTSGSQYASINENGKVTINSGVQNQTITVHCVYDEYSDDKTITISYDNQLSIECATELTGTSGTAIARYNSEVVTPTWSITSGNQHASIDSNGEITIVSNGTIIIQATYSSYTTSKTVNVTYVSGTSSTTEINDDGSVTTTTTTTVENQDGSTTETSSSTTTHDDGSISITESETNTNQDGSSTTTSTTTNQDGTSSETETNIASDGSSVSSTTNYDENGDPTSGSNNTTDVEGNSNTQELTYDENGDATVTGYTIDTSGNESGTGEELTGNGVNTEFVAFSNPQTEGFEMHIVFRTVKTEQPNPPLVVDTEDSGSNYLFNIMTCKSPDKPYRGFHIRWALAKKNYSSGNLVLGYTASNASSTTSRTLYGVNDIYDITIIYDPLLVKYPSKFRCISNQGQFSTVSANITFESTQFDVVLGYAINQQGNPYRYSNVTIYEFSITKL